jgi:hypothetical protein
MLQLMEAEVVFPDPGDPNPGIAMLVKYGFSVETLADSTEYWAGRPSDRRTNQKGFYPSSDNPRDRQGGARASNRRFAIVR